MVLPAPFGPIRREDLRPPARSGRRRRAPPPRRSACVTPTSSSSALTPRPARRGRRAPRWRPGRAPRRLDALRRRPRRLAAERAHAAGALGQLGPALPGRQQALRPEDHHDHERGAEDAAPGSRCEPAEPLRQPGDEERAEDDAGQVAGAAEHHRGRGSSADRMNGKFAGVIEIVWPAKTTPAEPPIAAPIANAPELEPERRHAHQLGRVLVLPDRRPGPADPAAAPAASR